LRSPVPQRSRRLSEPVVVIRSKVSLPTVVAIAIGQ
jgi:hypothetical protein